MNSAKYRVMPWLLTVLLLAGCATAAMVGVGAGAGVGTYSYTRGELALDYPYPFDRTWDASLAAVEKLDIQLTQQGRDSLGGRITGKRTDGKVVVIKVKDKGLGVTHVGVRVGTFGNREASRKIQETILAILRS
jgi:hypothetical protein